MIDGRIESNGAGYSNARVVFHTRAYIMLMSAAQAAMPGEIAGLLFGSAQYTATGQSWITVREIVPVDFADTGTNARRNSLQIALERMGKHNAALQVVGWFYADPGTGVFTPRVPISATQKRLPAGATLFLLVNPAADQGAFYVWNGQKYLPTGGFYEAVPDEGALPIIGWTGEIRGVTSWLGPMLAEFGADSATKQLDQNTLETSADPFGVPEIHVDMPTDDLQEQYLPEANTLYQGEYANRVQNTQASDEDTVVIARVENGGPLLTADEPDPEYSAPFFVEVITEEPVEYVPPEMTPPTAELPSFSMPEIASIIGYADPAAISDGDDTMPYPVMPDAPGNAATMPHEIILPAPPINVNDDTMPYPILLEPQGGDIDAIDAIDDMGGITKPHPLSTGVLSEVDDLQPGKAYNTVPFGYSYSIASGTTEVAEEETESTPNTPNTPRSPTFVDAPVFRRVIAITAPLGPAPDLSDLASDMEAEGTAVAPEDISSDDEIKAEKAQVPQYERGSQITGPLSLTDVPPEIAWWQAATDEQSSISAPALIDGIESAEPSAEQSVPVPLVPSTVTSGATASDQTVITGALLPSARSVIRPVVRQNNWLEAMMAIAGALGLAIVGIFLVADMLAKQNNVVPNNSIITPISTVTVGFDSSEAAARNPSSIPPTETPTETPTPISTWTPVTEPTQTPKGENITPPISP